MAKFGILFYQKADGLKPIKDFLLSLDTKMRAKMFLTIDILRENGHDLRKPYSKSLEDGIFELCAKVGINITRVLYFFVVATRLY